MQQPNLSEMMQQVQKLQKEMKKAQDELASDMLAASAGGGSLSCTISGEMELKSIKIDPKVVNPEEVELLEDLVLACVNEAIRKAKDHAASKLGGITGGLNLPGF